jgi:hypothetical protein
MRSFLLLILLAMLAGTIACAHHIGDGCSLSTDCSPNGDRICDLDSPGGYCTVPGCEYDNCPQEAICVRFFSISSTNRTCDPSMATRPFDPMATNACTPDEICTLSGYCVPRTAEIRFCMLACGRNKDCRDGYECRDEALMKQNGGEPVPAPGAAVTDNLRYFCAARRTN